MTLSEVSHDRVQELSLARNTARNRGENEMRNGYLRNREGRSIDMTLKFNDSSAAV